MILEEEGAFEMGRHTGCAMGEEEGGLELDFAGTDGTDA